MKLLKIQALMALVLVHVGCGDKLGDAVRTIKGENLHPPHPGFSATDAIGTWDVKTSPSSFFRGAPILPPPWTSPRIM